MKHLVLGSEGQIGFELCRYLTKMKEDVTKIDIVANNEEDLRIPNNEKIISKIKDCDFVHFLAFDVGGSRYLNNYQHTQEFLSNNIRLMENTFNLLQKYDKPFIFASSQMSNMSHSPYGILKALGECYTKSLNGLFVKFWNVYGLERDLEKSHVITDFILKAINHKKIEMLTDGTELRQFLHSIDCSNCLLTLANKYNEIDRSQNLHVTSFEWNSIIEVAKIVSELYPDISIETSPSKDNVQLDTRNEPDKSVLKFWKPVINLKKGIELVNQELIEVLKKK